ncbi:MAG: DUF420 domain-containing protein [Bacteroidetes Order II. Incertae sedis bacterium]|nr:DUF420 domain-containing protein [Bacteroidetes Order II. bacterium]
MTYQDLPALNAILNLLSTLLLLRGFLLIRQKDIARHRQTMIAAMASSAVFLTSYLTYHTLRQMDSGIGHTVFPEYAPDVLRYIYYGILVPHVVLAALVLPLVLMTFYRGLKTQQKGGSPYVARHRRIARFTFPVWLFVSVTGVVVYLLLYQVAPLFKG